jgi:hypothetical protein
MSAAEATSMVTSAVVRAIVVLVVVVVAGTKTRPGVTLGLLLLPTSSNPNPI